MATYLDDNDLNTLTGFTESAIKDARTDESVSDDALSHYYALKAKLTRIREGRVKDENDEPKPKKARKARTAKPQPTANTFEPEA